MNARARWVAEQSIVADAEHWREVLEPPQKIATPTEQLRLTARAAVLDWLEAIGSLPPNEERPG